MTKFAKKILPAEQAVMGGVAALLFVFPALSAGQIRLLPAPREAHFAGETAVPETVTVSVPGHDAEDEFAAGDLEAAAQAGGSRQGGAAFRVVLLRAGSAEGKAELAKSKLAFDAPMTDEGYVLVIEPHEAFVVAASRFGSFLWCADSQADASAGWNGKPVLPTGTVRDWPAMKYRGIDDDLSRGPFPTLEFMKHQLRVFAAYKINVYSPYMEHTLLYPDQPLAAPPGGALSPADVAELVSFARQYHITVHSRTGGLRSSASCSEV